MLFNSIQFFTFSSVHDLKALDVVVTQKERRNQLHQKMQIKI